MLLKYTHNDQVVGEGERSVFYENKKLYVRTGFLSSDVNDPDLKTITYRLREVYVADQINNPPNAVDSNTSTIDLGES